MPQQLQDLFCKQEIVRASLNGGSNVLLAEQPGGGPQNRTDRCNSDTGLHLCPATEQVNGHVCKTLQAGRDTLAGLQFLTWESLSEQSTWVTSRRSPVQIWLPTPILLPLKNRKRFTALVRLRARCKSGRGLHLESMLQ